MQVIIYSNERLSLWKVGSIIKVREKKILSWKTHFHEQCDNNQAAQMIFYEALDF